MKQFNRSKEIKNINFSLFFLLFALFANAQYFQETDRQISSDIEGYDQFGTSVAIDGEYTVIGAASKTEIVGVDTFYEVGAAYIFDTYTGYWTEKQKLLPSNVSSNAGFGYSVAIAGDYAIVGAPVVAIVGGTAPNVGAAYVFKNDGMGNWNEVQRLTASDSTSGDTFGSSISMSEDYAIIGAPVKTVGGMLNVGAAYIFKKDSVGNWTEIQKLNHSDPASFDQFGKSVAIDGDYAIIGAEGKTNTVGGAESGAAYIFEKDGTGNWNETQKLTASNAAPYDYFGASVGITKDYAIVGASFKDVKVGLDTLYDAGAVYVFEKDGGGNWNESQEITASDKAAEDYFGSAIAIEETSFVGSGTYFLVVGAWNKTLINGVDTFYSTGAAYVFEYAGFYWGELEKLYRSDTASGDQFGASVAVSNHYYPQTDPMNPGYYSDDIVVGANWKSPVVNGDTLCQGGTTYFFHGFIVNTKKNMLLEKNLTLYPNPTTGVLHFEEQPTSVTVIDQLGRIAGFYEPTTPQIDLSNLPNGLYFLRVKIDNEWLTAKVMKW